MGLQIWFNYCETQVFWFHELFTLIFIWIFQFHEIFLDAGTTSLTTKKALKVETEEMGIDDDKVGSLVQAMISKPNKKRVKNHENKNSMDVKSEEVEDQGKNKKSPNNGSRRHKKKESETNRH